jgi:glycerophosphoryl diester phosphodiesterase
MKIIAHRGASAVRPENTLAAFEEAVRAGADGIELDLHLTRDGRFAVLHDDLVRLGGDWRYVRELAWDELRRLDAGGGERVPSLDEVFAAVRGRCPLMLEIKASGMAEPLAGFLRRGTLGHDLHVTSFLHEEIAAMGRLCPELERSIVLAAIPIRFASLFEDAGVSQVSLFRGYVDRDVVARLRARDVRVRAYPVNVPWEAARMAEWGVEGIFTDDPAAMRALSAPDAPASGVPQEPD